jgi:hypothetical protein
LYVFFIFILISCGKEKSEVEFQEFDKEKLVSVINNYSSEDGGNKELDKIIYNEDKGIYFSLFKDNIMTYELVGLGVGKGIWELTDTSLIIKADTGLFDMIIDIKEKGTEGLHFFYRDRFGSQVVKVNIKNEQSL